MPAQRRAIGSVMAAADAGPLSAATGADSVWGRWTRGFARHAAFRTARSALAALLKQQRIERLWLPTYLCDVVADATVDLRIIWYGVDGRLDPRLDDLATLSPADAVLAVDYFGRSPGAAFRTFAAARADVLWIEDRAQALAPDAPPWGDVLLYSPRKLFGVADGGLLVSDLELPTPDPGDDDGALWAPEDARARDPDGREPASWFPLFRRREAAFAVDRAPISRRSRAALASIDAAPAIDQRRANYDHLRRRLPEFAFWPDVAADFAPLAFPILVEDRDAVAAAMAEREVFCARHWNDLACPKDAFADAWAMARTTLSIPCDQRYGEADMDRAAAALRRAARPAARR